MRTKDPLLGRTGPPQPRVHNGGQTLRRDARESRAELSRARLRAAPPSAAGDPDPGVGRSDQYSQADAAALLVAELPQRDRLGVACDPRRDVRRHVARLEPALGVPDRDRVGVVRILRLGDERERQSGREPRVLKCFEPIRRSGDRDDEKPLVRPANRLARRRVAQPVARLATLEPEAEPLAQKASSRRAASTTRLTDGMYASSICQ
jgi:hypothetical protein